MDPLSIGSQQRSAREQASSEMPDGSLNQLRWILLASIVLTAGAAYQFARLALSIGVIPSSWKWMSALILGIFSGFVEVILLIASFTQFRDGLLRFLEQAKRFLSRGRVLNLLGFTILIGLFPIIILGSYGKFVRGYFVRLYLFWILGLAGAVFLRSCFIHRKWTETLPLSLLLHALTYRVALFIPSVSTFPFSLGYSEGSRFYFASLFFGERIYGISGLSLPVLHPTRYLLQSIPFLITDSPLWLHRLWQVLLWVGTSSFVAWFLIRRLSLGTGTQRAIWFAWAFLFMFQGPIYYHLLVIIGLLVWGVNSKRFFKTLLIVALTSAWAGISRLNWIPLPGLLATTFYVLETAKSEKASIWAYLYPPLLWVVVGCTTALGANSIYTLLSREGGNWLNSIQNSPLLWYRLLPSPTFKTGVLFAILIASAPLFIVFFTNLRVRPQRWHPIRIMALASILGILFLGGLLVSVKIGGGDDLHNLDAFLIILMVTGSYMIFDRFVEDKPGPPILSKLYRFIVFIVLVFPIFFALGLGQPFRFPDLEKADVALSRLQQTVDETIAEQGEVLFISERHLVTFDLIQGVTLEPQYEKTFIMEMAMSDNQAYFDDFEADLQAGRFDLIVVGPQHTYFKEDDAIFGEEDNAWISHVSVLLLDHYRNMEILDTGWTRVALMEPKSVFAEN